MSGTSTMGQPDVRGLSGLIVEASHQRVHVGVLEAHAIELSCCCIFPWQNQGDSDLNGKKSWSSGQFSFTTHLVHVNVKALSETMIYLKDPESEFAESYHLSHPSSLACSLWHD